MKLSIITINYNNAEGLRKTLASVASQTYRDIEHIIVDGASTDGSVDVIKEYENQLHITHSPIHLLWSSEPDTGIYNAMNKGIEIALGRRVVNSLNRSERSDDKNRGIRKATGEYVQILNSGDLLAAPDVTERMMAALHQTSNIRHQTSISILYVNILKSSDVARCIRQSRSSISIKARSIMTARISAVIFLRNTASITSR